MYLTITSMDMRQVLLKAPLTVGLLHVVAGSFIDQAQTEFQRGLANTFHAEMYQSYAIEHLPDAAALITFSALKKPRTYAANKGDVRIRPPDAAQFCLWVRELRTQKPPTHLTCDKKACLS